MWAARNAELDPVVEALGAELEAELGQRFPEQTQEIVERAASRAHQPGPVGASLVGTEPLEQGENRFPPETLGGGVERGDLPFARVGREPGRSKRVEQFALSGIEAVRLGLFGLEPEVEPVE